MAHEGSPTIQETIFYPDGTLNEPLMIEQYGIGAEDSILEVSFGNYRGTVAQMLSNDQCPVGNMVSTAYRERGINGVAETFKNLEAMDSNFSARLSDKTLLREQEKKK